MKMGLFRKKPNSVRAFQWAGSQVEAEEIGRFLPDQVASRVGIEYARQDRPAHISLKTSSGLQNVRPMDWIVEDASGEWYPVRREIFEQTFDEVVDSAKESG